MWSQKKPDTKSTDTMSPLDATAGHESGWLGSSLRVKGDITGTEDLLIDGSVEGLIQLDGRKLTVGSARLREGQHTREGTGGDQERRLGNR
jgi:cytoskeletal protein CcmA (bactofilin family)